jgi:hypothetical protein
MKKILSISFISSLVLMGVLAFVVGRVEAQVNKVPSIVAPKPDVIFTSPDARSWINSTFLDLNLNPDGSEANLTAKFIFSVNGGSKGVNIYKNGGGVMFSNKTRNLEGIYPNSQTHSLTSTSSSVTLVKDDYNQEMYHIGAGQTATFTMTSSVLAKELLSGIYTAKFEYLYANLTQKLNQSGNIKLENQPVTPRTKTVIGEKSPYISSITNNNDGDGEFIKLTGERLKQVKKVYIDNSEILDKLILSPTADGAYLGLLTTYPLSVGSHSLYLVDPITGKSNIVSFQVGSTGDGIVISKDSASPEDQIVLVDEVNDTPHVILLAGKITNNSNEDIVIDSLPITLQTNGDSISAIANSLTLEFDIEHLYKESVVLVGKRQGIVNFDDLDFVIKAGDSVNFSVYANINDLNNSFLPGLDFDEGDYLRAFLSSENRDNMDIENGKGDQLELSERAGFASGEAQEFRTTGIGVTLVSTQTDSIVGDSKNDDIGLFTIKYKITAIGDDVYVASSTLRGLTYLLDVGGNAISSTTLNYISSTIVNNDDYTLTPTGNYKIEEGETETFTLTVSVPMGRGLPGGQYRNALKSIKWDTEDVPSLKNSYSTSLDEFMTRYIILDGTGPLSSINNTSSNNTTCPTGFTCSPSGMKPTLISTATDVTSGGGSPDVGLFTIKYRITATEDKQVYVSSVANSNGLTYQLQRGASISTAKNVNAAIVDNTDTTLSRLGNYVIEPGESEIFTLSISVEADKSGQYRASLKNIKWDTEDDITPDYTYFVGDDFTTSYKVLGQGGGPSVPDTGTTTPNSIQVYQPSEGDVWIENIPYSIRFHEIEGDFDYYQAFLDNKITKSGKSIGDQIIRKDPKTNSWSEIAWTPTKDEVNWFIKNANKLGVSEETIRNNFYITIEAVNKGFLGFGNSVISKGESGTFALVEATTTANCPKGFTCNRVGVTASVVVQNSNVDRAGTWGVFTGGKGNVNKDATDWNFKLDINTKDSLKVKRMTIIHGNEIWSTGEARFLDNGDALFNSNKETPYPLVVMKDGAAGQINTEYKNDLGLTLDGGNNRQVFRLFGQKESREFGGGKLIIEYTDGTRTELSIPRVSGVPECPAGYTCTPVITSVMGEAAKAGEIDACSVANIKGYFPRAGGAEPRIYIGGQQSKITQMSTSTLWVNTPCSLAVGNFYNVQYTIGPMMSNLYEVKVLSRVGSTTPSTGTSSITIIGPKDGEKVISQRKDNIYFSWKWNTEGIPSTPTASIIDAATGQELYGSILVLNNKSVKEGVGVLPSGVCSVYPDGPCVPGMKINHPYKLKICEFPENNLNFKGVPKCNVSGIFTIISPLFPSSSPSISPSITVITPNGGEKLVEGSNYIIKWTSKNLPSTSKIVINIYNGTTASISNPNKTIAVLPSSATSYSWTVKGNTNNPQDGWGIGKNSVLNKFVKLFVDEVSAASDQYIISLSVVDSEGYTLLPKNVYDSSDSYFTITSSASTIATPTISSTQTSVNSGSNLNLKFSYPSDTAEANIYVTCPSGVTGIACNKYTKVLGTSNWSGIFTNSGSQSQSVYFILYVKGSNGQVQTGSVSVKLYPITQTPSPSPSVYSSPKPSTSVSPSPTPYTTYSPSPTPSTYSTPVSSPTTVQSTTPSPSPTPTVVQPTISSTNSTVSSGSSANIRFTFPSNTTEANVYVSCPSGVTSSPSAVCNQYYSVLNNSTWNPVFYNNTGSSQSIYMIYYVKVSTGQVYTADLSLKLLAPTTSSTPSPSSSPTALRTSYSALVWDSFKVLLGF